MKLAVRSEAGVVDQQLDCNSMLFRELEYFLRRVSMCQIRSEYFRLDFALGSQFLRQLFQAFLPPRRQNEVCSAKRQFHGQSFADSRARSRNQRPPSRPGFHRTILPNALRAYHGAADDLFSERYPSGGEAFTGL